MNDRHATISVLRNSGHRLTSQRVEVLSAIEELGGHITVEQIHQRACQRDQLVDVATVYRTVGLLKRLHLVNEVLQGGVAHYELADPDHRHHHMVCEHCGKAIHLPPKFLDGLQEQLMRETGFEPHMEHFTISGLCSDCRKDLVHSHSGHPHHHGDDHTHEAPTVN